jgi:restriction endonuclease S subunit
MLFFRILVEAFEIAIPDLKTQEKNLEVLQQFDKTIQQLKQQKATWKLLKQKLLNEIFWVDYRASQYEINNLKHLVINNKIYNIAYRNMRYSKKDENNKLPNETAGYRYSA